MINTTANKNFIDQKTGISFVLGLLVGVVLMGVILALPSKQTSRFSADSVRKQLVSGQMTADVQRLSNSGARQQQINRENTMPWNIASNFIATAPIEKIQLLSGLSIKLFLKNGPTFTTTQPKADAYQEFLKKNDAKVEVVK